jgi:sulfane dehydrogenase subunit SoxC
MTKARSRLRHALSLGDLAAGNGILSRRIFLEGALVSGAAGAGTSSALAEPLAVQSWMKEPGAGFAPYGQPSRFEDKVARAILSPPNPPLPGIGTARTPLHLRITPSGVHFERPNDAVQCGG